MNKKIVGTLLISATIVILGLYFIMDLYLYIYDPDWRGILQEKEIQTKPRIFIIGSSSVYPINSTYISEFLEKNELNYEIFNLADMSDTPTHRLKSIEHLISLNPDVIVYGIGITDFENKHYEKNIKNTQIDFLKHNPKEVFNQVFSGFTGDNLIVKFPTSPKDRTILTAKYILKGPEYLNNPFINYKTTDIASPEILESYTTQIEFRGTDPLDSNEEKIALTNILEKFRENNIEIIIFSVPYHSTVFEKISTNDEEIFKRSLEKIGNEFDIESEFLHSNYKDMPIWRDPFHVAINKNVSIYSQDVAQIILEALQ